MLNLSPSSIGLFIKCPFSFNKRYIEKIPFKEKIYPSGLVGTVFHAIAETFFNEGVFTKERLMSIAEQSIKINNANTVIIDKHYDRLMSMLDTFYIEFNSKGLLISPYYTEHSFKKEFAFEKFPTLVLKGKIDLLLNKDQHFYLIDFKTGALDKEGTYIQGNIYMYLLPDIVLDSCYFFFPMDGKFIKVKRCDKVFLDLLLEKIVKTIELGNFNRKKGKHCIFCGYKNLCGQVEKDDKLYLGG